MAKTQFVPAAIAAVILAIIPACESSDSSAGTDASAATSDAATGGDDSDARPAQAPCEGLTAGAGDSVETISPDGTERSYRLHVPASYDPTAPTPLVLNFHGYTSNAYQQEIYSGMSAKADSEGFIAVHPDGISSSWNGGTCCGEASQTGVDDVGFVDALLDELEGSFCIDTSRIYATGMSNGGFMSHRLGCDLSDRIAAIAPVAGHDVTQSCAPTRPVPVMHFHGTADGTVPFSGTGPTIASWIERNGCDSQNKTVTFDDGNTTCETYGSCNAGAEVTLCTVEGFGHEWPGAFNNAADIVATDAMWPFFERYQR
jgi:polyhydroxybutyrate depolymerase